MTGRPDTQSRRQIVDERGARPLRQPTENEAWTRLCEATVRLATAFAEFEQAKGEYARARQEGMTVA